MRASIDGNSLLTDQGVVVFVRSPVLGKVKTRLARAIGAEKALGVYRLMAAHVINQARKAAPAAVCFTPAADLALVRQWLGADLFCWPQAQGDLGSKMAGAFADVFAWGWKKAVVVGSDIPQISAALMLEALEQLGQTDAVIGPAHDGGFYLIGFTSRTFAARVFDKVDWGTPTVLGQTIANMHTMGIGCQRLATFGDVDDFNGLKALICRRHQPPLPESLRRHLAAAAGIDDHAAIG
jgi:hypothetical protein